MTKFIYSIIVLVSFFSIANFVNASEGEISDILELETGIQASNLNEVYIKTVSLKTTSYKTKYTKMRGMDKTIKTEILRKIDAGEFDYYTGFDIIKAYSSFIYNVNRLFELYSFKENGYDDTYLDSNIRKTLFEIKTHYKRLQYLVNKD